MRIAHIIKEKRIKKSEKELEKERKEKHEKPDCWLIDECKEVPLKEPIYLVEMTVQEFQLISFYLELEKRKPIMKPNIEVVLKKED